MTQIDALARLRGLGVPVFTTQDITAALKVAPATANMIATRLARAGLLIHLARGRWALGSEVTPLLLPEHLAAPYPAYISLQSALFYHGMISQIPHVVYAVTLAKTHRWKTPLGVISLHQIAPDFFFGYAPVGPGGAQIASPEKALLDIFYLTLTRSRLFARLPEIELPKRFSTKATRQIISKIKDPRRRSAVQRRWENLRTS